MASLLATSIFAWQAIGSSAGHCIKVPSPSEDFSRYHFTELYDFLLATYLDSSLLQHATIVSITYLYSLALRGLLSFHLQLCLWSGLFLSGLATNILYTFVISDKNLIWQQNSINKLPCNQSINVFISLDFVYKIWKAS